MSRLPPSGRLLPPQERGWNRWKPRSLPGGAWERDGDGQLETAGTDGNADGTYHAPQSHVASF